MIMTVTRRLLEGLVTVLFLVVGGLVYLEEKRAQLFRRRARVKR